MLGQRRRQCASIETMLSACDCPEVWYACLPVWSVYPTGIHNNTQLTQGDVESMLVQRLPTIYDVEPTLSQL